LFDAVVVVFAAKPTDQTVRVIDERQCVFDVAFLGSFSEKFSCDRDHVRRKRPRMRDSVRFRIDGSVRPVLSSSIRIAF